MATNLDRSLEFSVPDQPAIHNQPATADRTVISGLHTTLERALIEEYLATRGQTLRSIDALPPAERDLLLRAATASATLKLAEIEARAHLLDKMA